MFDSSGTGVGSGVGANDSYVKPPLRLCVGPCLSKPSACHSPRSEFAKHTPLRVVFSTVFVLICKCGQTRSFIFDILRQTYQERLEQVKESKNRTGSK